VKNYFKKDIFSKNKIIWNNRNLLNQNLFGKINLFFTKKKIGKLKYIHKRSGIEINSNNFRIKINKNIFLLKKWSNNLSKKKIIKINKLNNILYKKINLIPKIIQINNKNEFLFNRQYWTLYKFLNGNHFSGSIKEFKNTSFNIGLLYKNLRKLRIQNNFPNGPRYNSYKNREIFNDIIKNKKNWNNMFGKKLENKLLQNWDLIKKTYNNNQKNKPLVKFKQLSHIDLHPHNILIKNKKVISFLDMESCRNMNPGYSLAFCCLKICKQTIIKSKIKNKNKLNLLVRLFIKEVSKNYPKINLLYKHFFYYASSEVLRRILIILNQNLQGIKTWNKVLGIQINHLKETDYLFKDL
tara:strand:+ start:11474 stop:12532 length:1059 start_codon:yes stop_codon:yes gene_type:complete